VSSLQLELDFTGEPLHEVAQRCRHGATFERGFGGVLEGRRGTADAAEAEHSRDSDELVRNLPEQVQGGGSAIGAKPLLGSEKAVPVGGQTLPESIAQFGQFRV
jgi:hypothetical protein